MHTPFQDRLTSDEVLIGAETVLGAPAIIELYGALDLDFAWVDFEHQNGSPYDTQTIEQFVRTAELADTELLIRPPSANRHIIAKMLDAGARTMLFPHVETKSDVEDILAETHYDRTDGGGNRKLGKGRANQWGVLGTPDLAAADRDVCVGVMIENQQAITNIDEIVAVDGLDFVFVGPWDFSQALGHPFEFDHPTVKKSMNNVQQACAAAGVPWGTYAVEEDRIAQAKNAGCQILLVGDELKAVIDTYQSVE